MNKNCKVHGSFAGLGLCILLLSVLLSAMLPLTAFAEDQNQKIIRVGRFPYDDQLKVDENGNYSGYGFDYLQEIAQYTGWTYEFCDGSWGQCLDMLKSGEIDLMGAVMLSPQRESVFHFSQYPMISGYGVLVTPMNNSILAFEDFSAFQGLKVGALSDNLQTEHFKQYSATHGFSAVIKNYNSQAEIDEALSSGEIQAAIMSGLLHSPTLRVIAAFGENDGYFAVSKDNTALLTQLNEAMGQIRLKDPYFNSNLNRKYNELQEPSQVSFTRNELEFIERTSSIPCIYIPNAFPLSYKDSQSGTVQGITADICRLLAKRTGLSFTWVDASSSSQAKEMLVSGDALILPSKIFDSNWAVQNHANFTEPYLYGQMSMITNLDSTAINKVALYDPAIQQHLSDILNTPTTQFKQYTTVKECMDAVYTKQVDATFLNSTVVSSLMSNPKYSHLRVTPLYDYSANISMAVSGQADPLLLPILDKGLQSISSAEINQIVLSQIHIGNDQSVANYLYLHPVKTVIVVSAVSLSLLFLLLFLLRSRQKSAKQMQTIMYTDGLTGYPNYQALIREAPSLIGLLPQRYALIYMDIHRFKVINDSFGYETGDRVLTATSQVLQRFIDSDERFARVYADTFVLLLRYSSQDRLNQRLTSLSALLDQIPQRIAINLNLLFCGGVYPLTEDFDSLEKACDRANYAKDSISHHFSSKFVFYDDVLRNQVLAEKELEGSMLAALEHGEFIPYYQPKVNAITERVVGAEALVRWIHPEKGCLCPYAFIPFYEKNGFIVKIDLAIFEQVCRDLKQWLEKGHEAIPVSVNFSRRHMRDLTLPVRLKEMADHYGVPTHLLDIEITETEELENTETAVDFVNSLKACGFSVSIDDYGTGYSSISFLQQLSLDTLKLDRMFILNAMKSDQARDIMRFLVSAMHRNGIRIMCEGVETLEQKAFIIRLNCRYIQGYLYSLPLPREAFEAYILLHGTENDEDLDFIPITSFQENAWDGAEDFLTGAMPSWIFVCRIEPSYPVYYISPSFLEGTGYSELEFKTETKGQYVNWIHPDDRPEVLNLLSKKHVETNGQTLQYRIRKKDDNYIWVREINKRIMVEGGVQALLCVCTEITDIVTLEKEKSQLIDTIPGGVGKLRLTEAGPIITQASHRFFHILGYTKEEMLALKNSLFPILCKEDFPRAEQMLIHLLRGDSDSCSCVLRIQKPDKSLHWISFHGTVSRSEDSCDITVIINNCDDEIHAVSASQAAKAKLELVSSLTGITFFELDLQSERITFDGTVLGLDHFTKTMNELPESLVQCGCIGPESLAAIHGVYRRILRGDPAFSFPLDVRPLAGGVNPPWQRSHISIRTLLDESGQPIKAVGLAQIMNIL